MDRLTTLDHLRIRAMALVGGEQFERRYADNVARAIEDHVADMAGVDRATESTMRLGGGDALRQQLSSFRSLNGEVEYRRLPLPLLQRTACQLRHVDPVTTNILRLWTALIAGNGISIEFPDPDARTIDGRDPSEVWEEFDDRQNYSSPGGVYWEAIQDTLAAGERFHLWDANLEDNELATDFRVLDPISRGGISDVVTVKGDGQQISHYKRRGLTGDAATVGVGFMTFWKLSESRAEVRGAPLIEPVIDDIIRLRQTAVALWLVQEFRLRIMALIHKRGTKSGKLGAMRLPKSGIQVLEVDHDGEVQFPDLRKISVGDRQDQTPIRQLLQRIGQGVNLPYNLVAMEFSAEGNRASLDAAENPAMKVADFWRSHFSRPIVEDVRHVVGPEVPIKATIHPVTMRDIAAERKSILELIQGRALDLKTGLEMMPGVEDPEQVIERLARVDAALAALLEDANLNEREFGDEPVPDQE